MQFFFIPTFTIFYIIYTPEQKQLFIICTFFAYDNFLLLLRLYNRPRSDPNFVIFRT